MKDERKPWWATDPELAEILRRSREEFERELELSAPAGPAKPDPVLAEVYGGACLRELAGARDDLAGARNRYQAAVLAARAAGYSWSEIGRVLGVSKQLLHRQFSRLGPTDP